MIQHQHSPSSMLKTPLSFVQGGQQHQIASNMKGIPTSDGYPGNNTSVINGGSEASQNKQPTQHHRVSGPVDQTANSTHHNVSAQRQNINSLQLQPSRCQQDQSFAQNFSKRHSMDLITTRGASTFGHTCTNNSGLQNNNLFHSSSHHTTHTAAAGDLLSMSRRSLDTALPDNSSNVITKKRSATMVDDMMSDVGVVCDGSSTNQGRFNTSNNIMQHLETQTPQLNTQRMSKGFNNNTPSLTSTSTNVSSPLIDEADGNDYDSYLNHRTIRQCLRADSFEMMDDC